MSSARSAAWHDLCAPLAQASDEAFLATLRKQQLLGVNLSATEPMTVVSMKNARSLRLSEADVAKVEPSLLLIVFSQDELQGRKRCVLQTVGGVVEGARRVDMDWLGLDLDGCTGSLPPSSCSSADVCLQHLTHGNAG
jgi:hypothetical protein